MAAARRRARSSDSGQEGRAHAGERRAGVRMGGNRAAVPDGVGGAAGAEVEAHADAALVEVRAAGRLPRGQSDHRHNRRLAVHDDAHVRRPADRDGPRTPGAAATRSSMIARSGRLPSEKCPPRIIRT